MRGKYDHFYDLIADGFEEKQREIYLKKMLDPGRYPYYMGKNQVKLYEGYMDGILMLHGISNRQYDELSPEKRKAFQIDIERAVGAVIEKYFECDGRGQSGIPDLYSLVNISLNISTKAISAIGMFLKNCVHEVKAST